jgi:hypothetical protein
VTYLTKYFFPNLCNGTYVELGALDGYKFTNTLSLHERSGWRGVLIEPNPLTFADLAKKRTDELLLGHHFTLTTLPSLCVILVRLTYLTVAVFITLAHHLSAYLSYTSLFPSFALSVYAAVCASDIV